MANSQKQVMDMRPGKGFTTAQSNEHTRNWTDKGWNQATKIGNYDRTRVGLNFEIVGGKVVPIDKSRSIPLRIKEILSARNIKDPNEGLAEPKYRTIANFIFGGSRERMHEIAFGEQKVDTSHGADNSKIVRKPEIGQWAMDVYNFVARKWGEENIASFVIHLDETNPHLHCTLLPIKDGKFAYKKLFAGSNLYDYKDKMRQLHDEFADVTAKWGFSRGSDVAKTGARNIPPHEYRRLLSPKFAYNLSENRILQMLQSMQTKIPQSSLNNWMHQLMTYMRISLENLLIDAVKRSYFTHNDEVRILVRSREAADAPFEYKVEYIHAALSLEQKLVVMLYKNEGSRGHEVPEEYLFKGSIDKCFCSDRAKLYETIETDLIQYRTKSNICLLLQADIITQFYLRKDIHHYANSQSLVRQWANFSTLP